MAGIQFTRVAGIQYTRVAGIQYTRGGNQGTPLTLTNYIILIKKVRFFKAATTLKDDLHICLLLRNKFETFQTIISSIHLMRRNMISLDIQLTYTNIVFIDLVNVKVLNNCNTYQIIGCYKRVFCNTFLYTLLLLDL